MNEHKNSRILVFDVETTGLLPKTDASGNVPTLGQYPYVLQFSFLVYNRTMKKIEKTHDYYIDIPSNVIIPEKITELTGINREICNKKGVPFVYAIEKFYNEYINCGCIIAHNYEFDKTMIKVELQRNKDKINEVAPYCLNAFSLLYEEVNKIRNFCTMRAGTSICNIAVNSESGKPYNKWPKLSELYFHLFKELPDGFHNSMVDILACLRCYLKMHINYEITKEEFQSLLEKIEKK
jgi:DNA polymerase III epsilon subunit-like protein